MSPIRARKQIIAVRFEGEPKLRHIVEHLVLDLDSAEIVASAKDDLIAFLRVEGNGSVICADNVGRTVQVTTEVVNGTTWLRTEPDGEFEDNLLSLYAYELPNERLQGAHLIAFEATSRKSGGLRRVAIRSDRTGVARLAPIRNVIDAIKSGPGPVVLERPTLPSPCEVNVVGLTISAGDFNGEDAIFAMPQCKLSPLSAFG